VGDIIRVHRVNMKVYRDQKQFNSNIWMKSSWVIFRGARDATEESLAHLKNRHFCGQLVNFED